MKKLHLLLVSMVMLAFSSTSLAVTCPSKLMTVFSGKLVEVPDYGVALCSFEDGKLLYIAGADNSEYDDYEVIDYNSIKRYRVIDKSDNTVEFGFVFDYDEKTYKLTNTYKYGTDELLWSSISTKSDSGYTSNDLNEDAEIYDNTIHYKEYYGNW